MHVQQPKSSLSAHSTAACMQEEPPKPLWGARRAQRPHRGAARSRGRQGGSLPGCAAAVSEKGERTDTW